MAEASLKLGSDWATKEGSLLGFNDQNGNYKPIPFDFTRATTATRVNRDGLIEEVQEGVPRIDFSSGDGSLLLEPQRTNLVDQSEYLTSVSAATISHNQAISPDGGNNAMKLTADSGLNNHYVSSSQFSIASGGVVGSVFAKKGNVNWLRLRLNLTTSGTRAWFDLENGVVGNVDSGGEAQIIDMGNGWYRCIVIESGNTSTSANATLQMFIQNQDNQTSWDADGDEYVYLYGAQEENPASYATSYIKTSGSAVTRNADDMTSVFSSQIPTTGNVSYFIELNGSNSSGNVTGQVASMYFSGGDYITYNANGASYHRFRVNVGGTGNYYTSNVTKSTAAKCLCVVNGDYVKIFVNGQQRAEGTLTGTPILNTLTQFNNTMTDSIGELPIKNIIVFPTALTDEEAIELTTL